MTDEEKKAFKESFREKHKDEFVNILGAFFNLKMSFIALLFRKWQVGTYQKEMSMWN